MTALKDLQTDRNKIIELTGVIERMEKDKSKIQDWVKAKEKEVNDFEARALNVRKELDALKSKTDSDIKESEKKKTELYKLQQSVNQDLKELKELKAENDRIERDNASRFNVLEGKEARLNSLDLEVTKKLNKWNEIRESFLLIK